MAVETVNFVLDLYDGAQDLVTRGMAILQPSVPVTDTANHQAVVSPVTAYFSDGNSTVPLQFALRACDDPDLAPAGWQWTVSFVNVPGQPAGFSFFLNAAAGATQYLSSMAAVPAVKPMAAYLPLPASGTYPGGTAEFLRADQTWDVPPGGGSGSGAAIPGAAGDGETLDTSAIQAWLNTTPAGSVAQVPFTPAGYLCGALTVPAGIKLVFDGGAKLIAPSSLAVPWLSAQAGVVHQGTAIIGGTFDASAVTSPAVTAVIDFAGTHGCPNLRIQDNRIINAPVTGVQVGENTSNWTLAMKWITGNSVEEHGIAGTGFGIYCDYVGNVLIDGNYCYTAGIDDNIELGHSGPRFLGIDAHLRCTNNYCVGGEINYPFSDFAEIVNNTVVGNTIQNDGNTANNVQIIGNRVFGAAPGSSFAGISHWGTYGQIIGNYISVTTGNGIGGSWSNEVVANNYVTSAASPDAGYAIYPGGGGYQNSITGNVLMGSFSYGLYSAFRESAVIGNTFNTFNGLQVNGIEYSYVMGNNFNVQNEALIGTPGPGTVMIANAGGDGWGTFQLPASAASGAPLNIPPGTSPAAPDGGDLWNSGGSLYFFNGTSAQEIQPGLLPGNNLSDLASAPAAVANLGLGTAATQASTAFDAAGAAATAQATAETFATSAVATEAARAETAEALAAQKSANLSDLANAGTARTNLGLGSAAVQPSSAFDAAGAASTAQAIAETFATSAVGTETTRAEAAEALLASSASVTTAVAAETARAEAAEALLAPKASPAFTGVPAAPTAAALTSTTQVASTAYADSAVAVEKTRAQTAEALAAQKSANLSDLASAATARTNLGLGTAATQASTAFDAAGAATSAVATETTRAQAAEGLLAPKASPALTGTPTAPTAGALTASTQVATTAYADAATGTETSRATAAEAANATAITLKAPLASPALTGTPTVPTAAALTATTQAASTAYADAATAAETTRASAAEAARLPLAGGVMTGNLELAAGASSLAPLTFQSGAKLTTAAAGGAEFDGTSFYLTAAASSRQVVGTEQIQVLSATYTLTSNTSAQPLLNATPNGALTVQAATTYLFEVFINGSGFSSSTHSLAFGMGGTATFTSINWVGSGTPASGGGGQWYQGNSANATQFQAAAASTNAFFLLKGVMRINAGGTVIPQITQQTASAAASVNTGTYFRCWPVGSNTLTSVGDWS